MDLNNTNSSLPLVTTKNQFYAISVMNLVKYSKGLAIFLLVANIVIAIVTVIGNMTVILLVKVYRQLRVPSNLLLASLAVADLINGLILQRANIVNIFNAVTQPVVHFNRPWIIGFMDAIGLTILCSNIISLCLITLDRFIAIECSLRYVSLVTTCRVRYSIVGTWVVSIVAGVSCSKLASVGDSPRVFFFGILVLAVLFMISLYAKIYYVSRKHQKKIKAYQISSNPNMGTPYEYRGLHTAAMVTMILIASYLPLFLLVAETKITDPSTVTESHQVIRDVLRQCAHVLLFLNAALNPLLYFFRNEKARLYTRRMYRSVLDKLKCNEDVW